MGIVIINGKRYDSITGLAVNTIDSKINIESEEEASNSNLPSWINEYIQERKDEQSQANEPARVEVAHVRAATRVMRHHTSPSETLDRRFIKPVETAAKKSASIAIEASPSDAWQSAVKPAYAEDKTNDGAITVKHAVKTEASSPIWSIKPDTSEPGISPETDKLYEDNIARLSAILESAGALDNKSSKHNRKVAKKDRATAKNDNVKKPMADSRLVRKFSSRAIFATTGAVAVIVALGVYIAMPSISVRMAAADAGIDARNPYVPKGYTIDGKVAASKGKVKISYRNTSSNDGYSITQEKSSLTDSGLHNEVISQTTDYDSYQQIKANGKNIYLNGNTATWVNDGIKYTVDGNDFLDTDEITNIANSL